MINSGAPAEVDNQTIIVYTVSVTSQEHLVTPRRAARYDRILSAAQESFARFGFKKTTVEEISSRARVSKALVYKHFDSKEHIFETVVRHVVEEWSDALGHEVAAAGPGARDRLAAMHRGTIALASRPGLAELIGRRAQLVLQGWSDVVERATTQWKQEIEAILRDGVESGEIRDDLDVESMADVIGELTLAYGNRAVLGDIDARSRRGGDSAIAVLLDGVCGRSG